MHNLYESDDLLNQYLLFHYASKDAFFPYDFPVTEALDFSKRCVWEGVDFDLLPRKTRALDLGCSVGRSAFEMSQVFDSVWVSIILRHLFMRSGIEGVRESSCGTFNLRSSINFRKSGFGV